jgi:anti-sigma regulatory factor (Ser/Thr protein kinase)
MLRNFLDNAFKYSLQGEILLRADCTGPAAVVTVSDQGVGMDTDDLAQACTRSNRGRSAAKAEAEGIGLGLAISRHMADLMQTGLDIVSQPGQGTRVMVRLPLAEDAVRVHAPAPPGPGRHRCRAAGRGGRERQARAATPWWCGWRKPARASPAAPRRRNCCWPCKADARRPISCWPITGWPRAPASTWWKRCARASARCRP